MNKGVNRTSIVDTSVIFSSGRKNVQSFPIPQYISYLSIALLKYKLFCKILSATVRPLYLLYILTVHGLYIVNNYIIIVNNIVNN